LENPPQKEMAEIDRLMPFLDLRAASGANSRAVSAREFFSVFM